MVTEPGQTAPYAPVNNVLAVIRRLRDRGLPDPLTFEELRRIGVPEGNAPRTLAALRFLALVDDEGQRTPALERLGRASTDEYPEILAEVIRAAYAPVFTIVDPSQDNGVAIYDAFRQYEPKAQRERMITLFLGLCQEAGVVPGGPPAARARVRRTQVAKPPTALPRGGEQEEPAPEPSPQFSGTDYRLLAALMQQLPKDGKWTQARRDRWIQAVTANADLLIEVIEEGTGE